MTGFLSVLRRELIGYFSTPVAYLFLVIFLILSSYLTFNAGFFEARQASLDAFFRNMPFLLMLFVPAIAMRVWSEERRSNTIELLFTLPLTAWQAVLGKFLAAWIVIISAVLLTFPMIITVSHLGDPDWGPIFTGYLGTCLLAGTYLAIGVFCSALSRSQVISFVLGVVACGVFLYAGNPSTLSILNRFLPLSLVEMFEFVSFQSRFESMTRGVAQLKDIIFFAGLTAGWLWANIIALEERRAAS